MRLTLLPMMLMLGWSATAAPAQGPGGLDAAFRRLDLPTSLLRVATGSEATARAVLGPPLRVTMTSGVDDELLRALVYHARQSTEIQVLLCGPATADEAACVSSPGSPAVYSVSILRRFADEAASRRFQALASQTLRRASKRTWIECDHPFYGLQGSAEATVERADGHSVLITLTRSAPTR